MRCVKFKNGQMVDVSLRFIENELQNKLKKNCIYSRAQLEPALNKKYIKMQGK